MRKFLCFLGVALAIATGYWAWRGMNPSPDPQPVTEKMLVQVALAGEPIVSLIYEFKNDTGLWPYRLNELIPKYSDGKQFSGWRYKWWPAGDWSLTRHDFEHDIEVAYHVSRAGEGRWLFDDGIGDSEITDQELLPPRKLELGLPSFDKTVTTIVSRIENDRRKTIHWKGVVSISYDRNQPASARFFCDEYLLEYPNDWWPNVVIAILDLKQGFVVDAHDRLDKWSKDKASYSDYFVCAWAFHLTGDEAGAMRYLELASKFEVSDLSPDYVVTGEQLGIQGDYLAWLGCKTAYRHKEWKIVLAIADRWEAYSHKYVTDKSYEVFLAACYLRLGEFAQARTHMDKALSKGVVERKAQWATNLDELDAKITQGDKNYAYEFEDEDTFKIFIDYK